MNTYTDINKHGSLRFWIKEKRLDLNLTQEEFAQKIGTSTSIAAKMEIGGRKLGVVELFTICERLDIDPCEPIEFLKAIKNQ